MTTKKMVIHYVFAAALVGMLFYLVVTGVVKPQPFQDMVLAALTGLGVYHSSNALSGQQSNTGSQREGDSPQSLVSDEVKPQAQPEEGSNDAQS